MPSKPDTGQCRACKRRKPLNKHGKIARHLHLTTTCVGSQLRPVEGSAVYIDRRPVQPRNQRHGVTNPTIKERIAYMLKIIMDNKPLTAADVARARRTVVHFESRLDAGEESA